MPLPPYLAAVDQQRKRIFVLAKPNLSAVKINGEWHYCEPLSDSEIPHYQLVTDFEIAKELVEEARKAINL